MSFIRLERVGGLVDKLRLEHIVLTCSKKKLTVKKSHESLPHQSMSSRNLTRYNMTPHHAACTHFFRVMLARIPTTIAPQSILCDANRLNAKGMAENVLNIKKN